MYWIKTEHVDLFPNKIQTIKNELNKFTKILIKKHLMLDIKFKFKIDHI